MGRHPRKRALQLHYVYQKQRNRRCRGHFIRITLKRGQDTLKALMNLYQLTP